MSCDIELEIGAGSGPSEFITRVVRAASGGEPSAGMHLDVDGLLQNRDALLTTVLASAVPGRPIRSRGAEQLRRVGQQLFDALFSGPVRGAYRASKGMAVQQGEPLRVVLRLTAPRLAALPWEALFDPETGAYLCRREPLVRHVPADYTREPTEVDPPLQVLGVVASPRGLDPLDVPAEQERLSKALASPIDEGLIRLEWLAQASWADVQEKQMCRKNCCPGSGMCCISSATVTTTPAKTKDSSPWSVLMAVPTWWAQNDWPICCIGPTAHFAWWC